MSDRLLTAEQVAELLGASVKTVRRNGQLDAWHDV
jgi:hypothetical protein